MGWASHYIERLQAGETVSFRPRGQSMAGRIASGQLCTVEPLRRAPVRNDIVLCSVRGAQYLHIVTGVRNGQVQISNNHGHVNGWTPLRCIYGVLIRVE